MIARSYDSEETRLIYARPYGVWTTADGCKVLFDREYRPMLQLRPGGTVEPADPREWVPWVKQDHYYVDVCRDETAARRRAREKARAELCAAILEAWEVGKPLAGPYAQMWDRATGEITGPSPRAWP